MIMPLLTACVASTLISRTSVVVNKERAEIRIVAHFSIKFTITHSESYTLNDVQHQAGISVRMKVQHITNSPVRDTRTEHGNIILRKKTM